MSEPTIEIPARVAVLALKHFHHLAKIMPSHSEAFTKLSDDLTISVVSQITDNELKQVLVSARIQESL